MAERRHAEQGSTAGQPAPRVALIAPYWDFWEHSTPFDLRSSRVALLSRGRRLIEPVSEVVLELLADEATLDSVRARLIASRPDVIVVMQTMATPPAVTVAMLDGLGAVPMVVWAARATSTVTSDFDHAAVTSEGATVGTPMLTSMLVRHGRPFELVVGPVDGHQTALDLDLAIRAAAAAARVRRARIARVGVPIAGYACVDLDAERLREQIGPTIVPVEPGEFLALFRGADERDVEHELADLSTAATIDSTVDRVGLERAARASVALRSLTERHLLDGGAFNCHVPEIRLGPEVSIAPCLALGQHTTAGRPWTCAGDVVTMVPMLLLKALGVAALYHELEAYDHETGVFVQANTGEHDATLDCDRLPELVTNPWYPGAVGSPCVRMTPRPGPATLVGFAQIDQPALHRLIIAPGSFVGEGFPRTGTSNAGFRFEGADPAGSWRAWCLAGANHHGAVAGGDHTEVLRRAGALLGLEVVVIREGGAA